MSDHRLHSGSCSAQIAGLLLLLLIIGAIGELFS